MYAHDADMIYTPGRDETTGTPIDLSDTHTRLGRMVITQTAAITDKTVLAVLLAESTTEVAEALTAALGVPTDYAAVPAPTGHDSRRPRSASCASVTRTGQSRLTSTRHLQMTRYQHRRPTSCKQNRPPRQREHGARRAARRSPPAAHRPQSCTPTVYGSPTEPASNSLSRSCTWDRSPSWPTPTTSATS